MKRASISRGIFFSESGIISTTSRPQSPTNGNDMADVKNYQKGETPTDLAKKLDSDECLIILIQNSRGHFSCL